MFEHEDVIIVNVLQRRLLLLVLLLLICNNNWNYLYFLFILGQSTSSSPKKGPEFSLLSVRRANSCPEIKKTNGSSISSGTSPLQEETEEDHGDGLNISNGHTSGVSVSLLILNVNIIY